MRAAGKASIVVVTRDRPARLRSCLELLIPQRAREVLVIDDGSHDETAVAAVARGAGARLVRTEPHGIASARNTGAAHAEGEFVLFTDDDCAAAAGWAQALAARLAAGADVVAGPTVARRPDRALDAAWQLIADALIARHRADNSFQPGSNFGARAATLAALPFDARFDGVGAEDRDWWARVAASHLRIAYAPDAAVDHRPDLGLVRFARKQARYGRGAYRFHAAHPHGCPDGAVFYGRLVRDAARQGPDVAALVLLAQAATAAGFAAEAVRPRARR
jgi:glycosyltransferase involved in cell wall biosynthesis